MRRPGQCCHAQQIAAPHRSVIEIGCGQGTDGLMLCRLLPPGGSYVGIDYSDESLWRAREAAMQCRSELRVAPRFVRGNAEELPLSGSSVDCIYSMGVLHHSPNTRRVVPELRRVLRPGGTAFVLLYRRWAPKVAAAHACRLAQSGIDRIAGEPRSIYRWLSRRPIPAALGTALLEGFGVPVLRSYTAAGVRRLFDGLVLRRLLPCGNNLPPVARRLGARDPKPDAFGVFYFIVALKL
jgi:SAM-dependent methyltransferase